MKKVFVFLFAFLFCLSGGILLTSSFNMDKVASAEDINYSEINVSNGQQLLSTLSANSTYNNPNVKIVLTDDIDLEGIDLSPAYLERRVFTGFFEGNGYEVSNFTLSSNTNVYGLIPYASGAIFQNIRITGAVSFSFTENSLPIYAGVLVGQGENVTIKNCELYNVTVNMVDEGGEQVEERSEQTISIPVSSNLTFGGIIGLATSYSSVLESSLTTLQNCINYYDLQITLNTNSRIAVGGIVGALNSGSRVINCLNYGNINITKSSQVTETSASSQYVGGIAGEISGNSTTIKNTAYGGTISSNITDANFYAGTLVGYLNCARASTNYNVNFSYWSQSALNYYGTGYSITSDYLSQQPVINRAFLSDTSHFDSVEPSFDFDYDFTMIDGEILLQRFQDYTLEFNSPLDNGNIISSATFESDNQSATSSAINVRYGEEITITITFADDYVGYYKLSSTTAPISTTTGQLSAEYYTATPLTSSRGIYGYEILLTACDRTDGVYSFTLDEEQYLCEFEISEQADAESQGLLRRIGADRSTSHISFPFSYRSRSLSVRAEGSGVYSFSHWELYYRDSSGQFTEQVSLNDEIRTSAVVTVEYGTAPWSEEFKLVAYFTDEEAVLLTIGNYSSEAVSSITVDETPYTGEEMRIPPNGTITLEIITNSGYVMDVDAFTVLIQRLYGDNTTDGLVSDPIVNEGTGQTTYRFRINMTYLRPNITDNQLPLTLIITEDGSVNGDDLLWVYIVVPIVAVLIIGLIIFFIIRHRRGGGGGKKAKAVKESGKKENYRDYYV